MIHDFCVVMGMFWNRVIYRVRLMPYERVASIVRSRRINMWSILHRMYI